MCCGIHLYLLVCRPSLYCLPSPGSAGYCRYYCWFFGTRNWSIRTQTRRKHGSKQWQRRSSRPEGIPRGELWPQFLASLLKVVARRTARVVIHDPHVAGLFSAPNQAPVLHTHRCVLVLFFVELACRKKYFQVDQLRKAHLEEDGTMHEPCIGIRGCIRLLS